MDKRDHARFYASNGFRVFPVLPGSKVPATREWPAKATTDLASIDEWWQENPDYNIGIATGGGVVAIDADVKDGKPGLQSLELMELELGVPAGMRTKTPSGGLHVLLKSDRPIRNRANTLAGYPGIDIRGDGGYVLGAGSFTDEGPRTVEGLYVLNGSRTLQAAPDAFYDMLAKHQAAHKPHTAAPITDLDDPLAVAKAISYLEGMAPSAIEGDGGDDTTFRVAARLRDYGLSESLALELMLDRWNETKAVPPWMPDELQTKVGNAYRFATGTWGGSNVHADFGIVEDTADAPDFAVPADFDEGRRPSREQIAAASAPKAQPVKPIKATPYSWIEPQNIPKREWLYGKHFIRKYVSVTVAPGNIGKSSLTIAESLAMVSGKPLLGVAPEKPLNVWYINLEDPYDELQRRYQAAAQRYHLAPDDIGQRLFVDSGRLQSLRVAIADKDGARIVRPVMDSVIAEMRRHEIDCLIVDPFVSSHAVPENDNPAIDMVVKEWGKVADATNASIELVHHTRKQGEGEIVTESARGGKALTDAARDVRTLNRMTQEEAAKAGIPNHRYFFRTYSDKANMAPPADSSEWYRLESVHLDNGDDVGVVAQWEWPDAFAEIGVDDIRKVQRAITGKEYRESVLSKEWVGIAIGQVVGLDPEAAADKSKIKELIRGWVNAGWLRVEKVRDEKGKDRPIVVVGQAMADVDSSDTAGLE